MQVYGVIIVVGTVTNMIDSVMLHQYWFCRRNLSEASAWCDKLRHQAHMNWNEYWWVSGSQCDQFQKPASSDSSSISRAGILKAMVSYGSAAT
jgi:hypothetical protein